jgi:lysophospholipase
MARQYLNNLPGNTAWSDVANAKRFVNAEIPFPILVSAGRTLDDSNDLSETNKTIFEISPFEFGSWDSSTTGAFIPTMDLGTSFVKGSPAGTCVRGFDNAA